MKTKHSERIADVREMMSRNGWDAVVVSGSDPHSSEYPSPRWQQVKWLSGFTGEAGDMVITQDHAGLWTDSRYFIQAMEQLEGTGVELHKTRVPDAVDIPQWLAGRAEVIAVDGLCQSVSAVNDIRAAFSGLENDACQNVEGAGICSIVDVPDMLDALWKDRPAIPVSPVTTLDVECFGGISREEKIGWLRKWMLLQGVDRVLLSSLDEIAWMLNVRGNDIEYNPLVISYLLVSQDYVRWFVKKENASSDADTDDSFAELAADGISIEGYDSVFYALKDFSGESASVRIFTDPSTLNYHVYSCIKETYPDECIVTMVLQWSVSCIGLRRKSLQARWSRNGRLRKDLRNSGPGYRAIGETVSRIYQPMVPELHFRIIPPRRKALQSSVHMDCTLSIRADSILQVRRISHALFRWESVHI